MRILYMFAIAAILVVAGCASQPVQQTGDPSFRILSPGQGQVISDDKAVVSLETQNIIIASPSDEIIPGQGHFHLFLDNGEAVITPAAVYTFENLASGEHTIRIELHRSDHSQFSPPIIKSVSFTIAAPPGTGLGGVATVALKEFNMTAKQFEFIPSTITVKKGDMVKLNINSTDVAHGFSLSAFGVNEMLPVGQTKTVSFTADKTGEFAFFCSVACGSGHTNMKGKLIVNP